VVRVWIALPATSESIAVSLRSVIVVFAPESLKPIAVALGPPSCAQQTLSTRVAPSAMAQASFPLGQYPSRVRG
jgi:hypothetical protein